MDTPAVIVKKGGFLSSLASGLFGLLITAVICAAGVGIYGLNVVDRKIDVALGLSDHVLALVGDVASGAKQWKDILPPALADAIDDERAGDYEDDLDVSVRLVPADRGDHARAVFEIANHGDRVVSLLALNVVVEDEDGVPLFDFRTYAATPLALDDSHWRGPIRPGQTRKFVESLLAPIHGWRGRPALKDVSVEIVDLRVFCEHSPEDASAPPEPEPAP
jgi:hypothetical protein